MRPALRFCRSQTHGPNVLTLLALCAGMTAMRFCQWPISSCGALPSIAAGNRRWASDGRPMARPPHATNSALARSSTRPSPMFVSLRRGRRRRFSPTWWTLSALPGDSRLGDLTASSTRCAAPASPARPPQTREASHDAQTYARRPFFFQPGAPGRPRPGRARHGADGFLQSFEWVDCCFPLVPYC